MPYTPPFTITKKILDLVAKISERVGRLDAAGFNPSPMLRKQNRIKTITGTLAIEGNTLTEEQVTAILDGKRVIGSVREVAEVRGAISAYETLPKFNPTRLDDLLSAHGLMMGDVLSKAGAFRTGAVGIQKKHEVHHVAPPAQRVPKLMADLAGRLKASTDHPLVASCVFHYEFEFIHPFIDGNGRMGRLWQTLILSKWQPLFLDVPLESAVKDHQKQYYQALEQADDQAQSTPFIELMLTIIDQTLAQNDPQNVPVNAPLNVPVNLRHGTTPAAVLDLIARQPQLTRQQMAQIIGKNVRTISRAIATLQQAGAIKRIGSDKTGRWEVVIDDE